MKYRILSVLVVAFGMLWFTHAAYQNQGFSSYTDNVDGSISFICPSQCIILLDSIEEIITLSGNIQWTGTIWYGYFLSDNMLYPAASTKVDSQLNEYSWKLVDSPIYRQFKNQSPKIVVLLEGSLSATSVSVFQRNQLLSEKITQFWATEKLAPYTVNLRYGPYWGATSWPKVWMFLVILITLLVLIFSGKKYTVKSGFELFLSVAVGVMIFWGIRVLVDNIKITNEGKNTFTVENSLRFYDLDDYIAVTKEIRNTLKLDDVNMRRNKQCTINANAHQPWPFVTHWDFVYFRPCTNTNTGSEADYIIYYKVPAVVWANQTVLATGNNFTLLQNNH